MYIHVRKFILSKYNYEMVDGFRLYLLLKRILFLVTIIKANFLGTSLLKLTIFRILRTHLIYLSLYLRALAEWGVVWGAVQPATGQCRVMMRPTALCSISRRLYLGWRRRLRFAALRNAPPVKDQVQNLVPSPLHAVHVAARAKWFLLLEHHWEYSSRYASLSLYLF